MAWACPRCFFGRAGNPAAGAVPAVAGAPRLAYGPGGLPEGGGHWAAVAGIRGGACPRRFFDRAGNPAAGAVPAVTGAPRLAYGPGGLPESGGY
jgi:hypothetical protein